MKRGGKREEKRQRAKMSTRASTSFPFLPRSLVTTTLGFEFKAEAARIPRREGKKNFVRSWGEGSKKERGEREGSAMETCWAQMREE